MPLWLASLLVMFVLICFFGSLLFCNCCSSFGRLPYLRERRPSMELSFQRRAAFVGLPSILRGSADWPFASSVSHFIYTNRCDRFHLSVWRRLVCCSVGDTVSTVSVPAAHRYSRHLSQTHGQVCAILRQTFCNRWANAARTARDPRRVVCKSLSEGCIHMFFRSSLVSIVHWIYLPHWESA